MKYGGEDIPGSPFEMTSNADTTDVYGDSSRKNSGIGCNFLYPVVTRYK